MAIKIQTLKRVFRHGATNIPDPMPSANPETVLEVLSASYPTFANAAIEGPSIEGGDQVFTIKTNVGTKG